MLILSPDGSSCLQYAAADVLQRAGYSVWTDNNPCLEGIRMVVVSDVDLSWGNATLTGYNSGAVTWTPDVSVSIGLDGKLTLHDVQLLVAKLTASPGFRKMVETTLASESAGRFVTEPISSADISRSCGERWPSSPFTVE